MKIMHLFIFILNSEMYSSGTFLRLAFIILLIPRLVCTDDVTEHSFIYYKTEYLLSDLRVNWDEAQVICETYGNGSLAIIREEEVRNFLAKCIEGTAPNANVYWIGAHRKKSCAIFNWIDNGEQYKPDKYFVSQFISKERECLSFSRQFHNIGQFINFDCKIKHGFICEKPFEGKCDGSLTMTDWITINDHKYGIFYDRRTWPEAVRECHKKYKADLAILQHRNETMLLGKYLLIGRPSLENAWIGGRYKGNAWRFISEDTIIPDEMDNGTLFPPWHLNRTTRRKGCLLLDRHVAYQAVFVETRCSRRMSYICSKKISQVPEIISYVFDDIKYTLVTEKKTWDDAYETCLKLNATLVKATKSSLVVLTHMMGNNKEAAIYHAWIGGRLNDDGTYFKWVEDDEIIPKQSIGINGYPPWYDVDFNLNYPCLNLDRENHNRPFFYGADCGYAQEFICAQKSPTRRDALGDSDHSRSEDSVNFRFEEIGIEERYLEEELLY